MGNLVVAVKDGGDDLDRFDASSRDLVLVVDDENLIRSTVSGVLSDEGFRTISAKNGVEALEQVREHHPAVVFLDIWMPGWDGIETLEKIKEASPLTEVIMISGHASVSSALEAAKRGAFDFIEKPLDIENIILALNRALDHRGRLLARLEQEGLPLDQVLPQHLVERSRLGVKPVLTNPAMMTQGMRGRNFGQRTLKQGVILYGQGLHSGQKSGLVLEPLPVNSGIHFARIGSSRAVPANLDFVESTAFATTLRSKDTVAGTIEHLMSALHAYRITNLLIKCNREVPIFDGSASEFCRVIERAGVEEQGGEWFEVVVDERHTFKPPGSKSGLEEISIEPADNFTVAYELQYPDPVGQQRFEYILDGAESYKEQIAPARTFGFMKDIERLQKAGLAAGGRLDNFILIGPEKVLNTELRFAEELARHKILDAIGDLYLLGRPLRAKITARMTGHSDNVGLLGLIKSRALVG